MAEAYAGLVGAYGYAFRQSPSWLLRTYAVTSAAVGTYVGLLFLLSAITWIGSPVAFGERAFLGAIGILLLLPLFAPVLVVARRHRRDAGDPIADQWLGLAGFAFVGSVLLALFISDPSATAAQSAFGPAGAWLDHLPDASGVIPPLVAAAVIAAVVRITRPSS